MTLSVKSTEASSYGMVLTVTVVCRIWISPEEGGSMFSSAVSTRSASRDTSVASLAGLRLMMVGAVTSVVPVVKVHSVLAVIPSHVLLASSNR